MRQTIDGAACVRALLRAGFSIRHYGTGLTLLRRGTRLVLVPDVEIVTPPMFEAIVRSAGLEHAEFVELLHPPRKSRRRAIDDEAPPSSVDR